jgi:hypothetical protein
MRTDAITVDQGGGHDERRLVRRSAFGVRRSRPVSVLSAAPARGMND